MQWKWTLIEKCNPPLPIFYLISKMMPNLRTYIKFKNVFEVEPYVLPFMSRQRRSYLAQLRNGILPLQLEVGR